MGFPEPLRMNGVAAAAKAHGVTRIARENCINLSHDHASRE
jgi:hypothetical protein